MGGRRGSNTFDKMRYDGADQGETMLAIHTPKASFTPLTQNATLAMMLQTNCSDIGGPNDLNAGGFEIDRTTGSALNATSCEIANQIRRSLAVGNSLLSTNNLAEAGSTRGGNPPFFERQQPNSVGKARSYSAVRLGSRPVHNSGNRTRPHFEQIGRGFGIGGGAYPLVNNYSTIIPRKRNFAANLHESSS